MCIKSDDDKVVDGKGIGRKVIDKMLQTYSSELAGKDFAYDGEKCLFTVGPLPQNNFEFTVIMEETSSRYVCIFNHSNYMSLHNLQSVKYLNNGPFLFFFTRNHFFFLVSAIS